LLAPLRRKLFSEILILPRCPVDQWGTEESSVTPSGWPGSVSGRPNFFQKIHLTIFTAKVRIPELNSDARKFPRAGRCGPHMVALLHPRREPCSILGVSPAPTSDHNKSTTLSSLLGYQSSIGGPLRAKGRGLSILYPYSGPSWWRTE
jgi:hypothetical protein